MHFIPFATAMQALSAEVKRHLVKILEPVLWKPASPEGLEPWQQGTEIRCPAFAYSILTRGTIEDPHAHRETWEMYQVLEGTLRILVKRFRNDDWQLVSLEAHDTLVLAPGTYHLLDASCDHVSQVIQAPPANTDRLTDLSEREIGHARQLLAQR